jgi:membrane protein DedA with SNARE-associated domain
VSNLLEPLLNHLLGIPAPWVLAIIGALVFSEAAFFLGFVLPGETAVLIGAFLASSGHLSVVLLVIVVVAAAIVGDTVGYEVGRQFGPRLLTWRPLRNHQHRVDGARAFLDGRGAPAVFIGRFTAFLRAVVPGLAGLSRMRYRRFLAYNAAGGLVWGTGVVLLGYFAGHSYRKVESWLGRSGAILIAAVVVIGLVLWHRARSRRERARADD